MSNLSVYRKAKKFLKIIERAKLFERHYMAQKSPKIIERELEKHEKDLQLNGGETYCLFYTKDNLPHVWNTSGYKNRIKSSDVFKYNIVKNTIDRFFLGDEYPHSYDILVRRQTDFQKWLDKHPSYNAAMRKFQKKNIMAYYGCGYETREIRLLPLEVMLDTLAAKTIIGWCQIKQDGIESYRELPNYEIKKISDKATELLNLIKQSDYPIENGISRLFMETLSSLSQGLTNPRVGWTTKYELKTAHIDKVRYRISKSHQKAMREVLIRMVCSIYMWTFGQYKLDTKTKSSAQQGECSGRFFYKYKDVTESAGVWSPQHRPNIHADVIINLLGIIDDFSDDEISERKIQEISSKQRERDLEYKYPPAARL
ncbi:MAG: hypothetical protein JAY74_25600 [Candidatus Thiodiazotropha taylori]|nr:hypothetical protein [Candidatus Thiodiazotropha taylori]